MINFGRDEENRYVIAPSITVFLKFVLTQLESLNFVVLEVEGTKTWQLKNPEAGTFLDALEDLRLPFGAASTQTETAGDADEFARWVGSLDSTWKEIVAGALRPGATGFAGVSSIKELMLIRINVSDLSPLDKFTGLRKLILSANPIRDITPLKFLPELKKLFLSNTLVDDLQPLKDLPNLTSLNLTNLSLTDISPLKSLKQLKSLDIGGCTMIDLEAVSQLKGLTGLNIGNAQYPDFNCLQKLTNLTELHLSGTNVADLSFLKSLKKLKRLEIRDTQVVDFSVLGTLPKLGDVTCSFNDFCTIKAADSTKAQLRNLWYDDQETRAGLP